MVQFLKDTLRSRRKLFLSATAMTIVLKLSTLAPALILGRIIDNLALAEGMDTPFIAILLFTLCGAVLLQSVLNPLQTYQLVSLVQSTLADMSTRWTTKILGKEFEQFSSLRIGSLIKSVERGITAHEKFLTFFITSGFPLIIELILIAVVFAYLGGVSIFVALLAVSAGYMLLFRKLVNWRRPYLVAVNDQEDHLCSTLYQTLQAGKSIKLEQACSHAMIPMAQSYADYAQAATKVASSGAVLGSLRILYLGLSAVALLAWGAHDQLSTSPCLTVGELVAAFSIASMFLNNFSALAEAYRALDQFLVDKQKLQETLSLADLTAVPQTEFAHPLRSLRLPAIQQVNNRPLHFIAEQSVAIIGASGAGKTTLLEALAGTVREYREQIVVNGEQMTSGDIQAYLARVRYCPQHPVFLEGDFEHSVLFGHELSPGLSRTAAALGLHAIVANRRISEGANNISGGEAKRLSLLRLMNRPGDFNLFDEPTAGLDKETASRVWDHCFELFHDKGLVCTTHDLSVLTRVDRVLVMKLGSVIADGAWADIEHTRVVRQTLDEIAGEQMASSPALT